MSLLEARSCNRMGMADWTQCRGLMIRVCTDAQWTQILGNKCYCINPYKCIYDAKTSTLNYGILKGGVLRGVYNPIIPNSP